MSLPYVLTLIFSYLIGGIPFALFIGKMHGIDIRKHGSGNVGATNVGRCCGKKWGILTFLLDACKGFIPVFVVMNMVDHPDLVNKELAGIIASFGAYVGHVFTPYLWFKGGKGVATSAGALFALTPIPTAIALLSWAIALAFSRYISLASIVAAFVLPIAALVLRFTGNDTMSDAILALLIFLGLLTVFRHKANIKRLMNGEEPKVGMKKELNDENCST